MTTANHTRRDLMDRLGFEDGHRPTVEVVEHEGASYLVTGGTGDGSFAYRASDVARWLDATEGRAEPAEEDGGWYQAFCDALQPVEDAALAHAVFAETGEVICHAGICSPVVELSELEARA